MSDQNDKKLMILETTNEMQWNDIKTTETLLVNDDFVFAIPAIPPMRKRKEKKAEIKNEWTIIEGGNYPDESEILTEASCGTFNLKSRAHISGKNENNMKYTEVVIDGHFLVYDDDSWNKKQMLELFYILDAFAQFKRLPPQNIKNSNDIWSKTTEEFYISTDEVLILDALDTTDVDKEALDTTDVDKEALDIIDVDKNGSDSTDVDTEGSDSTDVDKEALDITDVDKNGSDSTDVDTEGSDSTDVDKEALDTTDVDKEARDTTDVDKEALDITDVDKEALNTTDVDKEALDTTDVDKEALDTTDVEKEALDITDVDTEGSDSTDVDTEGSESTIVDILNDEEFTFTEIAERETEQNDQHAPNETEKIEVASLCKEQDSIFDDNRKSRYEKIMPNQETLDFFKDAFSSTFLDFSIESQDIIAHQLDEFQILKLTEDQAAFIDIPLNDIKPYEDEFSSIIDSRKKNSKRMLDLNSTKKTKKPWWRSLGSTFTCCFVAPK